MWFSSTRLRYDIKTWAAAGAHCISCNMWKRRANKTQFLWPVTVPFWIMHADFWSPGAIDDADGNKINLLNFTRDLSQFNNPSITTSKEAHILAQIFILDVVMTFGM